MPGRIHPRVGGAWMSAVAPWGDVEWSTDEHGSKEASFGFYLPRGEKHSALTRGATVHLMDAAASRWYGLVGSVDWREGRVTAYGLAREAEGIECLDAFGNHTSVPDEAVGRWVTVTGHVSRGEGLPSTPYTASTDGGNTVAALLDSYANELGQRWFVEEDGVVDMAADPTTPVLQIRPGLVEMGVVDQDYASAAAVRYQDASAGGAYRTVIRAASTQYGYREVRVDATVLGPISTARAEDIGDSVLAKGKARLGWVSAVDVTADDMLNMGGKPSDLVAAKARQMVRIFEPQDDGSPYLDAVIGTTSYADGSGIATIAPMGTTGQSLTDIIEETLLVAAGRKVA